ncbi:unnamed protein product [Cylindrotheca closterium]|uniref:Uncharacterized protein n=1 Tax=Cylindrotheca closterium TaxID=2856 RepID=A0AAD2G3N7_9STRA|nr:unnamed protein product [Cylindrotheca closterium]
MLASSRRGGLQASRSITRGSRVEMNAQHRSSSTTSSSSRLVVSRRAWQAHTKTLPSRPKATKKKADEKPWPREYQLAGYAAAAIFIPYSLLWFALSNPTAREQMEEIAPGLVDSPRMRKHFGELEWDVQAYGDKDEGIIPAFYHYPGESGYRERQKEATVQERNKAQVEANLYLQSDETSSVETKKVAASTLANPECLKQAFGVANDYSEAKVALEFPSDDEDDGGSAESTSGGELSLSDQLSTDFVEEDPTLRLRQEHHTFSSWHYIPTLSAEEKKAQAQSQSMSDLDVDIARLEYTIGEVERDMKDPNCTKDRDTMDEDRSKARSELRKLKWRRRLGIK